MGIEANIVKYLLPEGLLPQETHPIVLLYYELSVLKTLYRQGWLKPGREISKEHAESDADHVFGVALLGYIIATEYRPDLDAAKVMRLGLFHELGEIKAGDTTPHDGVSLEDKAKSEYEAVQKVFSHMPNGERYVAIWKEYEDGITPEAKFVKEIDKLEMALQDSMYEKLGYNGRLDDFFPYVKERLTSPELKEIFEALLQVR